MWIFQLLVAVVAENPPNPMISAMSVFNLSDVFRQKTDFLFGSVTTLKKNRNKDLLHQIGVDFLGVVMEVFQIQSVVDQREEPGEGHSNGRPNLVSENDCDFNDSKITKSQIQTFGHFCDLGHPIRDEPPFTSDGY